MITKHVKHGLLMPEVGDIFNLENNQRGYILIKIKDKDRAIDKKINFDLTKNLETFSNIYFKLYKYYLSKEIIKVIINFIDNKKYELIIERKAGE